MKAFSQARHAYTAQLSQLQSNIKCSSHMHFTYKRMSCYDATSLMQLHSAVKR